MEIEEEKEEQFDPSLKRKNSLCTNEEENVFVAVGKEVKEGISCVRWALKNYRTLKKLVLLHVHCPSQWIPMMGGEFPVSQFDRQQVISFRQQEKQVLVKTLDVYKSFCKRFEVQVEKLVIEMDDVARGLVELIVQNDITQLVMGAAADKHYSKKMKSPKSKKACIVQKEAPLSCKIWFVCKQNLICTREAKPDGYEVTASPVGSSSSKSSLGDTFHSPSVEVDPLPMAGASSSQSRLSAEKNDSDALERAPEPQCLEGPLGFNSSLSKEGLLGLNSSLSNEGCEDGSSIAQPREDDYHLLPTSKQLEALTLNCNLYHQPDLAIGDAADLEDEAYAESCQHPKAEKELVDAKHKAKASKTRNARETELQKEIQEALEREKHGIERLKNQQGEIFEELQTAQRQKAMLESKIIKSDCASKDLKQKLSTTQNLLNSLKSERDHLKWECDNATREVKALQQMEVEANVSSYSSSNFSQFTSLELEQATHKFESSLVIGQGGYGHVYKGYIHHTPVAIKLLHPENLQGQSEFYQEVDILSRARHPNLVTILGACSESQALVYEYLPNGSLEDHLTCKNDTPPLSWHVRARISYEVCCALVFLHLAKPSAIVHGDLKPANILLDANLVSKLGDFGISRLISPSSTTTSLYHYTVPKGTAAYMDAEFLSTGDLTPQTDVYSFGIVLLRLLTGKPALGIVKEVREAVDKGKLQNVLDPAAGDWPLQHAEQLAYLGIRCCEVNRKNRSDLMNEVWRLEKMKDGPLSFRSSSSLGSSQENRTGVPPYFICPISQEIMKDPCVAADGYTYESETFRKWLESGKKTSPRTNLRLSHDILTPNHALRTAIQEWLQQRHT